MAKNDTTVNEFLLLGFPQIKGYKTYCLFFTILTAYVMGFSINSLVIVLVATKPKLHAPMFFFIQQLSIVEITFLTVINPNMLHVIWMEGATIPMRNCITQMYLYCAVGCSECHLLMVMSYDRYLAICNPLRYGSVMNGKLQKGLVIYCWVFGFLLTQTTLNFVCQLHFCGPNVIDHFFCDALPFVELACSNTFPLKVELVAVSILIMVIPFLLVVISYTRIIITILRISSDTGRRKAFSTCGSHLIVVTLLYGTVISIYLVPANGQTLSLNKLLFFFNIVITPLFNPIIYSLKNQEIKVSIVKLFR
ncbi:olfactory receptor 10A3-like [Gastrophryne carolinensis]